MLNFTDLLLPNESYIGYMDDLVAEVRVFRFQARFSDELIEARIETPFDWFHLYAGHEIARAVVMSFRCEIRVRTFPGLLDLFVREVVDAAYPQNQDTRPAQEAYRWN